MEFFRFLEKETKLLDRGLLILSCFAAAINLFLVFALTTAASKAIQHQSNTWELASVALGLYCYWVSEGFVLRRMTVVVEGIVELVRLRIVEKIHYADLISIERIGRAPTYNAISTHSLNIALGATGIIRAFTALVFVCSAFLIILYISGMAFLILTGTVAVLIIIFNFHQDKANAGWSAAMRQDNQFIHAFGNLIDGFKEVKMNSAKANDFIEVGLRPLAAEGKKLRTEVGFEVNRCMLLVTSGLCIVLGALVFLLPLFSPPEVTKLPSLIIFAVFLVGPLSQVVAIFPILSQAIASIREIQRVEKLLDSIYEEGLADPVSETGPALPFNTLLCTALAFSYRDERGRPSFSLEPLDFQLSRGELVFITGGNGSGKSTFLKVLAGLYPPARGTIAVNSVVVDRDNRQRYRHLFSNVFSDFHLFDRLYGIKEVDQVRVRDLLELTELSHQTSIEGHRITTLSLSTGQRKRLALVLSLLEDKPILLLDEWAIEQDPAFRRKFYREILPWLKRQEKTVVAVTHDDDHYDVADRVLKMQFGNFVPGVRD